MNKMYFVQLLRIQFPCRHASFNHSEGIVHLVSISKISDFILCASITKKKVAREKLHVWKRNRDSVA